MKGDVIVFPQNLETGVEGIVQTGAKSWIDAMMTGISWVSSTFKVTLVGPQDEFTGPHLSRPRPYGKRASRALVPSLTLLQRFLVGDSDY